MSDQIRKLSINQSRSRFRWEGGEEKAKSLTLTFQRQPSEQSGPVAEHFEIDTSELLPGNYSLQLEIVDNSSKAKKEVTWYFDLALKKLNRDN